MPYPSYASICLRLHATASPLSSSSHRRLASASIQRRATPSLSVPSSSTAPCLCSGSSPSPLQLDGTPRGHKITEMGQVEQRAKEIEEANRAKSGRNRAKSISNRWNHVPNKPFTARIIFFFYHTWGHWFPHVLLDA